MRKVEEEGRNVQEDNRERWWQADKEAIKFNIITSLAGTKCVNKQRGTCYVPKDADLRLLVYSTYLFYMMTQFPRGKHGELYNPDTTSNTTAGPTAVPRANSQVLECFKFYDPLSPNLI